MTDLMNGYLDIDGFTFHPYTRLEEVKNYFGTQLEVYDLGSEILVQLPDPCYITANIYAYEFYFNKAGLIKACTLCPIAPPMVQDEGNGEIPKYKLGIAKQWLQVMLCIAPQTLNETAVGYTLPAVGYYASVVTDIHYGFKGGDIYVLFREE